MSPSVQAPSRSLLRVLKASSKQHPCPCDRSKRILSQQRRHLSSTIPQRQEQNAAPQTDPTPATPAPRWSQTPPAMKAPVRARAQRQEKFKVNGDPAKLDAMYTQFLGRTGPKMLSDETKWLAVTHKSFDHARRGFNDRMAFLGRQIVELQTSLGLLTAADANSHMSRSDDAYGRQPFHHPAIENVEVLNGGGKQFFLHHHQMSGIAARYGLPEVVRWQPKDVHDLPGSGCDMVYAQALYAIVGALALEQGGQVANRIARERILQPVGLSSRLLEDAPTEQQQINS